MTSKEVRRYLADIGRRGGRAVTGAAKAGRREDRVRAGQASGKARRVKRALKKLKEMQDEEERNAAEG